MGIGYFLQFGFAQHALEAAFLVAVSCGLIGPFVITRTMVSGCARGEFSPYSRLLCSSWVFSPPTPVPTTTAVRTPSSP